MNNRKDLHNRLICILRELERKRQYRGLKRYVRGLRKKKPRNGKQEYIYRGASAYLSRLQADRRARSLSLVEFVQCDEHRESFAAEILQSDYKAWLRTVEIYYPGR